MAIAEAERNVRQRAFDEANERYETATDNFNSANSAADDAKAAADRAEAALNEAEALLDAINPKNYDEFLNTETWQEYQAARNRRNLGVELFNNAADAEEAAYDALGEATNEFNEAFSAFSSAGRALDNAIVAHRSAQRAVERACGNNELETLLENIEVGSTDGIIQNYRDHARNANVEDRAIEENERQNGSSTGSSTQNCSIGSGSSCTSVSFSINDGSNTGGQTTYTLGGTTLASNLANSSTTFSGTAASGTTQTLVVSCSGSASCFFDFTVLSGATCPTLSVVPIALNNSVSHTCTIN